MSYNYLAKFGSAGSGNGQFDAPVGITANDTYIYVVDFFNARIQVFDINTYAYVNKFGSENSSPYGINAPNGQFGGFFDYSNIAINTNYIYVSDYQNSRVQIFDINTYAYVNKFGGAGSGNGQFYLTGVIAIDTNYIYVTDPYQDRVQIFDINTYAYVNKFGTYGTGNGQFDYPVGITVDDNYIYVIDQNNIRIQIFNKSTYAYVNKFNTLDNVNDTLSQITLDDTNLYITDEYHDRIQIFNKLTYDYVDTFGSTGSGDGQFSFPEGIFKYNNKLYITDEMNNRVQIFASSSQPGAEYTEAVSLSDQSFGSAYKHTSVVDGISLIDSTNANVNKYTFASDGILLVESSDMNSVNLNSAANLSFTEQSTFVIGVKFRSTINLSCKATTRISVFSMALTGRWYIDYDRLGEVFRSYEILRSSIEKSYNEIVAKTQPNDVGTTQGLKLLALCKKKIDISLGNKESFLNTKLILKQLAAYLRVAYMLIAKAR